MSFFDKLAGLFIISLIFAWGKNLYKYTEYTKEHIEKLESTIGNLEYTIEKMNSKIKKDTVNICEIKTEAQILEEKRLSNIAQAIDYWLSGAKEKPYVNEDDLKKLRNKYPDFVRKYRLYK